MNEEELRKQRDIYWMLCVFLMVITMLLLIYIGGHDFLKPGKAVWKSFSLGDTIHIAAANADTAKKLNKNTH